MDNISSLYHTSLDKIKPNGQNEYTALCPFHEDRNPSFSFNDSEGVSNCFACGWKGNAYKYALDRGFENPKQYIIDNGSNGSYTPKPIAVKKDTSPTPNLDKMMEQYKDTLKAKWSDTEYNGMWDKNLIDEVGIGLDNKGLLQFAHHDKDGQIISIRTHKDKQVGDGRCKWYLRHKIGSYRHDKELFILEGEKDVLTLYSWGKQTTSSTTGARSIPKDLNGDNDFEWLKGWKANIYICYDNDDSGRDGAKKMAKAIIKEHPSLNVFIIQWDKELPNKYDVYDAFVKDDNGQDWVNAIDNAKRYELPSSFHYIGGAEANSIIVPKQVEIIEKIMPKDVNIILGGTTGANKSYMAMQWGMSLVSNEDEFLGYKINSKDLRVLYIDTECGKDILTRRYQDIQQFLKWDNIVATKWAMISPKERIENIWDEIDQAIIRHRADVVFIDCLYNITENMDTSKSHNISKITDKITELKRRHRVTPVVIHHTNKGGHEEGLYIDRLSGGSALQNWIEHCIMITTTNESNKRMMRFAKSRVFSIPTCYYQLNWDDEKQMLTNDGVIDNPKHLLITEEAKKKWNDALEHMGDEFTWNDWLNKVEVLDKLSTTTAKNWMREVKSMDLVERVGQGQYKKKRKLIKEKE